MLTIDEKEIKEIAELMLLERLQEKPLDILPTINKCPACSYQW